MAMDSALNDWALIIMLVIICPGMGIVPLVTLLGWGNIVYKLKSRWLTLFSIVTIILMIYLTIKDPFSFWMTNPPFTIILLLIIANRWLLHRLNEQQRFYLVVFNSAFLIVLTLAAMHFSAIWSPSYEFWTENIWSTIFASTSVMLCIAFIVIVGLDSTNSDSKPKRKRGERYDLTLSIVAVGIAMGLGVGQVLNTYSAPFCSFELVTSPGLLLAMWRHGRRHDDSGD